MGGSEVRHGVVECTQRCGKVIRWAAVEVRHWAAECTQRCGKVIRWAAVEVRHGVVECTQRCGKLSLKETTDSCFVLAKVICAM